MTGQKKPLDDGLHFITAVLVLAINKHKAGVAQFSHERETAQVKGSACAHANRQTASVLLLIAVLQPFGNCWRDFVFQFAIRKSQSDVFRAFKLPTGRFQQLLHLAGVRRPNQDNQRSLGCFVQSVIKSVTNGLISGKACGCILHTTQEKRGVEPHRVLRTACKFFQPAGCGLDALAWNSPDWLHGN